MIFIVFDDFKEFYIHTCLFEFQLTWFFGCIFQTHLLTLKAESWKFAQCCSLLQLLAKCHHRRI